VVAAVFLAAALLQSPAQRASALVDAGVELSNRGRFNEAAEKFVQALALDPNLAEAHYLLGLVRQQDGRAQQALDSFRAALKINPRYGAAQARVCELDTHFARARETGYDAALAVCRRAIQLLPTDPEPHFHAGWLESTLGNHAAAIREYQTVLKMDPKFPRVKFQLAMAYIDSQDNARAIPLLRQIIAAEPANSNARFQLGSILARQDDCPAAIPMLESSDGSARKYYLLAGCYKKANRHSDAAAALAKVKQFRQGADARMQAKYLAAVAHKHAAAGAFDDAVTAYRAALDLAPDPTLEIDLAVVLLKKAEPSQVITLLNSRADPLARYQIALAHTSLNQLDQARTALEAAVQAKPDFAEAWYQLGITLLAQNNTAEAERALATAVRLRPDEPAMRDALSKARH
jgi:tetratricopeptide (TPR) repeat protein